MAKSLIQLPLGFLEVGFFGETFGLGRLFFPASLSEDASGFICLARMWDEELRSSGYQ